MSNRLIYNLATDTRLNGGSQDFLCFPDQKNEKSVGFKSTNEVCEMMNVDLIFWQSCVVPLCHCAASISRSFSFDQNRRILNIRKGHFLSPILPPTATGHCPYYDLIWSLVWRFLVTGVPPTVSKFYFFFERKKIIEYFCIEKQFSISEKKIWCGGFEQRPPVPELQSNRQRQGHQVDLEGFNDPDKTPVGFRANLTNILISFSLFVCYIFFIISIFGPGLWLAATTTLQDLVFRGSI